ncbi:hypothetical protein KKE03_03495 [Patescibacteria group bacterium]|nr:hypothetical protein [Patescibacteria group bacterium]
MEKKLKQSKYKTLVKFNNGIEIKADSMNWVLYTPSPRSYLYFSTLEDLLTEFLNLRIKELAIKNPAKTFESLAQSIQQAKTEIKQIIGGLTQVKIPAQSCSALQERQENPKND